MKNIKNLSNKMPLVAVVVFLLCLFSTSSVNAATSIVYVSCAGGTPGTSVIGPQDVAFRCSDGADPGLSTVTTSSPNVKGFRVTCSGSDTGQANGDAPGGGRKFSCKEANSSITVADARVGGSRERDTNDNGLEDIESKLTCDDGREGVQLSNPVESGDGQTSSDCLPFTEGSDNLAENPIIIYLAILTRFVMVGVGVIVTIVIVLAGIRYTMAKGNPQETQAAKDMIQKAIIGLVMYLFSGAIINYLIPGGLL